MEYAGRADPERREAAVKFGEDLVRHTRLKLFGLSASWSGPRLLGDGEEMSEGGFGRIVQRIGLLHGDSTSGSDPYLQVIASDLPGPDPVDLLRAEAIRPTEDFDARAPSPCRVTIPVEGVPVEFPGVRSGEGWAVRSIVGDESVSVVGVRFPWDDVELVHITDPEPYLRGRREWLHKLRPDVW